MGVKKELEMGMSTIESLGEMKAADRTLGESGRGRRTLPVLIPQTVVGPVFESPGFAKKKLADHKLDLA